MCSLNGPLGARHVQTDGGHVVTTPEITEVSGDESPCNGTWRPRTCSQGMNRIRIDAQEPREENLAHPQQTAHPMHVIGSVIAAGELGLVGADADFGVLPHPQFRVPHRYPSALVFCRASQFTIALLRSYYRKLITIYRHAICLPHVQMIYIT